MLSTIEATFGVVPFLTQLPLYHQTPSGNEELAGVCDLVEMKFIEWHLAMDPTGRSFDVSSASVSRGDGRLDVRNFLAYTALLFDQVYSALCPGACQARNRCKSKVGHGRC